jgi:hypothetical protein
MFMSAMVRIFSWGERWNVPLNEATAELNGTFHLSPNYRKHKECNGIRSIALLRVQFVFSINRIRQMLLVRWSQFILTRYSKLSKWDLMQIRLVKMAAAYSKPFNICLFWYYIKQIMNVFIRAMVRIFSFGERWNVPSFTSWKYSYHCTHKHSLFVYFICMTYNYRYC